MRSAQKRDKADNFSKLEVLIVEDSIFIADLLTTSLHTLGVKKVFVAHNVSECKKIILQQDSLKTVKNVDVIITEWLMPDSKGSDLIKWIREHEADTIKFLPIIVCSAYFNEGLVAQCRDMGVTDILAKPVSAEELANRLLHIVYHPRTYIETEKFFGPDRRRQNKDFSGEDRRQKERQETEHKHK